MMEVSSPPEYARTILRGISRSEAPGLCNRSEYLISIQGRVNAFTLHVGSRASVAVRQRRQARRELDAGRGGSANDEHRILACQRPDHFGPPLRIDCLRDRLRTAG